MAVRLVPGSRRASAAVLVVLAVVLFAAAAPANAQAIIKVNENVNIKFGFLLQPQAEFAEIPSGTTGTNGYAESFFLRRARFLMGGQVAKNVYFFMETEDVNLGRKTTATTTLGCGFASSSTPSPNGASTRPSTSWAASSASRTAASR